MLPLAISSASLVPKLIKPYAEAQRLPLECGAAATPSKTMQFGRES